MTKDKLIAKQQLEIEAFKIKEANDKLLIRKITHKFTGIGAPLNDNKLKFNTDQMRWAFEVLELIEQLD